MIPIPVAIAPNTGTMLSGVLVAAGFGGVSCATDEIVEVSMGIRVTTDVAALSGGTVVGTGVSAL